MYACMYVTTYPINNDTSTRERHFLNAKGVRLVG